MIEFHGVIFWCGFFGAYRYQMPTLGSQQYGPGVYQAGPAVHIQTGFASSDDGKK